MKMAEEENEDKPVKYKRIYPKDVISSVGLSKK